jgi:hypothetical protein
MECAQGRANFEEFCGFKDATLLGLRDSDSHIRAASDRRHGIGVEQSADFGSFRLSSTHTGFAEFEKVCA